jgi:H+/Cl- antiporter ClcA
MALTLTAGLSGWGLYAPALAAGAALGEVLLAVGAAVPPQADRDEGQKKQEAFHAAPGSIGLR